MSLTILAGAVVLGIGLLGWVRLAPSPPETWHVDPLEAAGTGTPNEVFVLPEGGARQAPVFDLSAPDLARRVDEMARARPRTSRLAGSPETGLMTFVQRSRWIGFPDYVTIRVLPRGDDAAMLAIWSRSRFGHSDMGVNAARVERWLAELQR